VGEVLPANYERITQGSCTPIGYSISRKEYFSIKETVLFLASSGQIDSSSQLKIKTVAQNFTHLLERYPNAKLLLITSTKRENSVERKAHVQSDILAVKKSLVQLGVRADSLPSLVDTKAWDAPRASDAIPHKILFRVILLPDYPLESANL